VQSRANGNGKGKRSYDERETDVSSSRYRVAVLAITRTARNSRGSPPMSTVRRIGWYSHVLVNRRCVGKTGIAAVATAITAAVSLKAIGPFVGTTVDSLLPRTPDSLRHWVARRSGREQRLHR